MSDVAATALDLKTELADNAESLLKVNAADLEVVIKHYNVTSEVVFDMVQSVREWYTKQPHLPQGQIHDRQILGHLMLRGFSVERTKEHIDNFYTARRRMPELLCGRNPEDPDLLWHLQKGMWHVLPKKTPENYRVSIFKIDSEGGNVCLSIKVAFLLIEYRIWNDASLGDCWIMDFNHVTVQHAMQLTPVLISKVIYFLRSCFGPKLKSLHLINMPPFAATILNLFKKGINAKLVDRFHVCKVEDIANLFPKEILPKEYGGTEITCQQIADEWLKTFQSAPWRKYLIEQDTVLADESKRLNPRKADEEFGVEGSFRKLGLD